MKKIVLLLLLTLISSAVFAQTTVNTSAIERIAKAAQNQKEARVSKLTAQTLADFASFQKSALSYQYYDYDLMFQSMDALRKSYMKLRNLSETAAQSVALQLNEPVSVANGQSSLRLASYLNMETCNLWYTEQEKFDAFGAALRSDLQKVTMPNEFKQTLASFREYVKDSKDLNPNWIFQSMMPVMDVFNKYVQANSPLVPAMARQIQEPMSAGWYEGKVVTSTFIKDHSCELWQIEDQLNAFRANLLKYTR